MDVLRHEDKAYELNPSLLASPIDRARQTFSPIVVCKEWDSSVSGEGQLVEITRPMKVTNRFAMWPDLHHSP